MDYLLYIGVFGALLVLIAFVLLQINKLKNTDLSYDLLNFLGSTTLVYYGIMTKTWPFVVLNSVWALVSLKDLINYSQKNAK